MFDFIWLSFGVEIFKLCVDSQTIHPTDGWLYAMHVHELNRKHSRNDHNNTNRRHIILMIAQLNGTDQRKYTERLLSHISRWFVAKVFIYFTQLCYDVTKAISLFENL